MTSKTLNILFIVLHYTVFAQSKVEYSVMDLSTKQILPYVSVYHKDSLVGFTNDSGIIFLKENKEYLFRKDGYLENISNEKHTFLEKENDGFTLEEIIIHQPKKLMNKQIGTRKAYTFPIANLEFITFISPKKNERNKSFHKIVFPYKLHKKIKDSENIFKLTIYSSSLNKLYTDYVILNKENRSIEFLITKDLNFDEKGLFIGIEKIQNPNEVVRYDILLAFDLYQSNLTYYKRNYIDNSNFETFEEIEMEDQFSKFYKTFPEPIVNKFKNLSPIFSIELF